MFEEEIQLEKQSKSLSLKNPFLYILLVIVAIGVGGAHWFIKQQKDITPDQAKVALEQSLKARGPAFVQFSVGDVRPSVKEKPRDPHYKLLEKAGFVKLANGTGGGVRVSLTPLGEGTFTRLPEFAKSKNLDGTQALRVPLAGRELVSVDKITMTSPNSATVEYTWKWEPNKIGEIFDATGSTVKTFSQWDRATLIKSYGVDFYHQQQKAKMNVVRSDKGWKVAVE